MVVSLDREVCRWRGVQAATVVGEGSARSLAGGSLSCCPARARPPALRPSTWRRRLGCAWPPWARARRASGRGRGRDRDEADERAPDDEDGCGRSACRSLRAWGTQGMRSRRQESAPIPPKGQSRARSGVASAGPGALAARAHIERSSLRLCTCTRIVGWSALVTWHARRRHQGRGGQSRARKEPWREGR